MEVPRVTPSSFCRPARYRRRAVAVPRGSFIVSVRRPSIGNLCPTDAIQDRVYPTRRLPSARLIR
ncbi:unnamed protein product, partial [Nesidiocoris tenuis]